MVSISHKDEWRIVGATVIPCPELNYRKLRFPIICDLISRGKVKTDELGPERKSVLWETTALCELREQASELALLIEGKL